MRTKKTNHRRCAVCFCCFADGHFFSFYILFAICTNCDVYNKGMIFFYLVPRQTKSLRCLCDAMRWDPVNVRWMHRIGIEGVVHERVDDRLSSCCVLCVCAVRFNKRENVSYTIFIDRVDNAHSHTDACIYMKLESDKQYNTHPCVRMHSHI